MLLGWAVLGLAVVLIAGGAFLTLYSTGGRRHIHCRAWVVHPTVYACDDGHSYLVQGHRLVDLGTRSPYGGGSLPTR